LIGHISKETNYTTSQIIAPKRFVFLGNIE